MNTAARSFYQAHGVASVEPAYEKQAVPEAVLMFCKHCLRYSMGWCPTHQKGHSPYREPYYLVGTDGKRFRLTFRLQELPNESQQLKAKDGAYV